MKNFIALFGLFLSFILLSHAQETRKCALDDVIQHDILNNAALRTTYLEQISGAVNDIAAYDTSLVTTDSVYTVQVVVHVVYLGNNKYENIPDNVVQSQIEALNRDYNLLNADSINLRPYFIPFRGKAKIKFELAKKTPGGQNTTGITRTQGNLGNLSGWDPLSTLIWTALGIEPLKEDFFLLTGSTGKSPWPASKYLNIYVCDLNYANRKCRTCLTLCDTCGALGGFAYPPSNAINWGGLALDHGKNDGIVIDFRFFGQNNWYALDSTSQRFRDFYAAGRTTVHEVGHYFGLQHQWGNVVNLPGLPVTDGCTVDDFMDDTPEEAEAFAANIPRGTLNPCDSTVNSCNKPYLGRDYPDMYENYMDYSTDLCYNLFTKQQVNMMRYNLLTRRAGIIVKREAEPVISSVYNPRMKDLGISIFPNPASGMLSVHFDKSFNKVVTIDIVDVAGKVVLTTQVKKNTVEHFINIQPLSDGLYAVKCYNDEFSVVQKLIKKN